jgi:hypothetical protein
MTQRFLAPEIIFEGIAKQKGTVNHDEHLITRGYLHGNVINGIHPDSANYAEVVSDGGVDKLKLKPLTVTDVTVNSTATDLDDFADNVYDGSNFQEGDIVFLTSMTPTECYIHNGGTAADAGDWELVNSGLSTAQVRAMLSASSGVNYNSSTGEFTADQAEIQGFFSAGTGLSYSAGQFQLNATSDQISEGSSNLFYQDSRARGALGVASVTGPNVQLLQYNSGTGVFSVELADVFGQFSAGTGLSWDGGGEFSLNANTDDIQQLAGATNKFYSDSLVDAYLSAGTGLSYSAGQFSLNANTDDIQELAGATNVYFTDQRARLALSAGTGLSYNSGTGQFALSANSDLVSEGSSNLYYTTARVQADVGVSSDAGELLSYSAGEFSLKLSQLRKAFMNQSLTANTALTLTHNLSEKLVHVTAMDSNSERIDLKVVFVSTTQVSVTSVVNLTGVDIAVSL